jgi:hypothetical protein
MLKALSHEAPIRPAIPQAFRTSRRKRSLNQTVSV